MMIKINLDNFIYPKQLKIKENILKNINKNSKRIRK
jgi:hypothetical protein